jgi:hypothetical protein
LKPPREKESLLSLTASKLLHVYDQTTTTAITTFSYTTVRIEEMCVKKILEIVVGTKARRE